MQYTRWWQLKLSFYFSSLPGFILIPIPGNNDPIWFIFFQIGWLNHQLVTGKRYTSRILKIFTNLEALTSPCFLDKKNKKPDGFLWAPKQKPKPPRLGSLFYLETAPWSQPKVLGGLKLMQTKIARVFFFDKKCKETFIKWRIYWFLNFVMFIFFQKIKRCFCCFCIVFFQDPTFSSYQGSSARCHGWTAGGGDLRFQSFFKILPWISREDDPNSNDNMGAKNHHLLQTCVPFGVDLEDE